MIKIEISESDKKYKYPVLMKGKITGIVVLFTESTEGSVVAVYDNNKYFDIGYYSDDWDMKKFIPFEGSIVLSSK